MNSRRKGAAGERELAGKLKEYGYDCRRGQQYAMVQAAEDARASELPAVFHRRNGCPWKVTMRLEDWMKLYQAAGNLS